MLSNDNLQLKTLSETKMQDYWKKSQISQLPVCNLYRAACSAYCVSKSVLFSLTHIEICCPLTPTLQAHPNYILILICLYINIVAVLTIKSSAEIE